ncbi:hypothetical protein F5890DRAFT_739849 [Lentinula detonsa]|uniref:Uncharacterized protein n=1 Tax=Lentinula detonsa TaxID=2804962 RepID=A0AA38UW14_9AGAR|nr:hypothetical protein F5890DRAFT_739849 [Lentinula detonsa]
MRNSGHLFDAVRNIYIHSVCTTFPSLSIVTQRLSFNVFLVVCDLYKSSSHYPLWLLLLDFLSCALWLSWLQRPTVNRKVESSSLSGAG